jgi:hypothetical protein
MRSRLRGQSSGHFSPASTEPAPKPAEQPSHPAWQSGSTAGFLAGRTRPARDQHRAVACPPELQALPKWVRQAPYARRFRTKAARSARCAGGICAVVARCSRQYTGRVPVGPFSRISRTLASWARESMAGAIVAEEHHVGQLQLGFRFPAALLHAIVRLLDLQPLERAPAHVGRRFRQGPDSSQGNSPASLRVKRERSSR